MLRDLWHNKTRTLLVVLSIAMGVMGMGMISGARVTLGREMTAAHMATNPHHAILSAEPFGPTLVQMVRKNPAVADAAGRREINARLQVGVE